MMATFEWTAQKCLENTQIHKRANSATYSQLRTLLISVKKSEMPEWLEAEAEAVNSTPLEAEAEVVEEAEAVEAAAEDEVEEGGNIYSPEGLRVYMMSTRRGLSG
jgi:hypothetical protein